MSDVKAGSIVRAKYCYLADGSKLRVRDAGSNGFDYLGSLTYTSNSLGLQLESAAFGDGVIRVTGTSQEINYFLTDHLGSVRVIVDKNGAVKERNDYYAFGAKHIRGDYPQSDNRYDYNGKEEQTTGYLKFLDYGARMYDGALGRWFNVDPLTEKAYEKTPYHYCSNNPVNRIDPDGMFETKFGASWYKFWNGGDEIRYGNGEYYVTESLTGEYGVKLISSWSGINSAAMLAFNTTLNDMFLDDYRAFNDAIFGMAPIIGSVDAANIAWNQERYFDYTGHMLLGVADGLSIGAVSAAKNIGAKTAAKSIGTATASATKTGARSLGAAAAGFSKNSFKAVDAKLLKKYGITDIHEFKQAYLGNKTNVSKFDVVKDTQNHELLIVRKETQQIVEYTGIIIR